MRLLLPLLLVLVCLFQFTHPGRGATAYYPNGHLQSSVSIHAPREGCDLFFALFLDLSPCFNSRTPGGVRLGAYEKMSCLLRVSIHAPREGCDENRGSGEAGEDSFNSRTPGGVRLMEQATQTTSRTFQFTHPGRGATEQGISCSNPHIVSIHAPREGCDRGFAPSPIWAIMFQFTHPGRGATRH